MAMHSADGRDPRAGQMMPMGREGYVAGPANSSMAAVAQLFARLSQEIEETQPPNCIHFIVNFLCKHYPEHLHGFASIWNMDPDLERERHEVVNFFKSHKISTAVAAHFTNAGYDTLDTLTTLSPDQLVDVEAFNNVKWLPGHKVRLQQIFSEIPARIRAYRQAHPNETAQVIGGRASSPRAMARASSPRSQYRGTSAYQPSVAYQPRPPSPSSITAFRGPSTTSAPYAAPYAAASSGVPGGPREYVVGVSAPVRVGQQALGAPMDMNRDGIPDVLQQPHVNYMGAPGAMAMPGQAARGALAAPHAALGHAYPQGMAPQHHAAGGFHMPKLF
jgi:hypothetical protein